MVDVTIAVDVVLVMVKVVVLAAGVVEWVVVDGTGKGVVVDLTGVVWVAMRLLGEEAETREGREDVSTWLVNEEGT